MPRAPLSCPCQRVHSGNFKLNLPVRLGASARLSPSPAGRVHSRPGATPVGGRRVFAAAAELRHAVHENIILTRNDVAVLHCTQCARPLCTPRRRGALARPQVVARNTGSPAGLFGGDGRGGTSTTQYKVTVLNLNLKLLVSNHGVGPGPGPGRRAPLWQIGARESGASAPSVNAALLMAVRQPKMSDREGRGDRLLIIQSPTWVTSASAMHGNALSSACADGNTGFTAPMACDTLRTPRKQRRPYQRRRCLMPGLSPSNSPGRRRSFLRLVDGVRQPVEPFVQTCVRHRNRVRGGPAEADGSAGSSSERNGQALPIDRSIRPAPSPDVAQVDWMYHVR